MQIRISNLSCETTRTDIIKLFSGFGKISVSQLRAIRNITTRLPVIFALVDIDNNATGSAAILKLNNTVLNGNRIMLTEAK